MRIARTLALSLATTLAVFAPTLARRRGGLTLIAMSSIADQPTLFDFDRRYLAPPTAAEPAALERRLLEVIEREAAHLAFPGRDDRSIRGPCTSHSRRAVAAVSAGSRGTRESRRRPPACRSSVGV